MADRSNFWKMVDRTKPSKLRVFGESELRDCQDYFVEIQSDPTLPPNEIITASERLALIRSEVDLRHSDAKHRQTQRLARWAIAAGTASATAAIITGVAQCVANKPARENWPAIIETPAVATGTSMQSSTSTPALAVMPSPTASPLPAENAASPSLAASPMASPKAKPTSEKAKAKRKARRVARPMSSGRTTDEAANPPAPGGGHGQVWVNTETGVYHREGSRFYGTTRRGKYMTEQDAVQRGYKPAPKGP